MMFPKPQSGLGYFEAKSERWCASQGQWWSSPVTVYPSIIYIITVNSADRRHWTCPDSVCRDIWHQESQASRAFVSSRHSKINQQPATTPFSHSSCWTVPAATLTTIPEYLRCPPVAPTLHGLSFTYWQSQTNGALNLASNDGSVECHLLMAGPVA